MTRVRVLAALLPVALLLVGCGSGTGVTASRVDAAMGATFARLYAVHARQLGREVTTRPRADARCRRGNASDPTSGAGDDWSCVVDYPFPDGHIQPITYDLQVQPSGCYTADGPAQVVGPQHQRTTSGTSVTNVLFEFDGCFDVS